MVEEREGKPFVLNQDGLGTGVSWKAQPTPEDTRKRTLSTRGSSPRTGTLTKEHMGSPFSANLREEAPLLTSGSLHSDGRDPSYLQRVPNLMGRIPSLLLGGLPSDAREI